MAIKRNLPWAPMLALASGLTALAAAAPPSAPQALPTPYPEARYQQMSARSPFAVATAVATAAPTPGFASQLYVDGVARVGSSEFVAIKSRDTEQTNVIFLQVGKSTPDGLKAESVKWSDELGKSTVTVSKAGEKATLIFDEENIKGTPTLPTPGGGAVRLPTLPGQGRPMNFPLQQNGQPQFNNRFLPPPNQSQMPNAANLPPGAINALHRRVRGLIQSGQ